MLYGNKFIVIEGMDGSGKTTVCTILSKKIKAELYKTPSWPFNDLRDPIDKSVEPKSRFLFYLSSVTHASSEISQLLTNKHVVCDRYILSTLCYHRAFDEKLDFFDENNFDILQPDFTIYLYADYNNRVKRISNRENLTITEVSNCVLHDKKYQDRVESEFFKYNNLIMIDTNDIVPEKVADIICVKLRQKQENL